MERPAKRARMSLPVAPHPVAALLDDAFRAFFLKQEAKKRPILPLQPFNKMAELRKLNRFVLVSATHPDASVYVNLPYDVQWLVRRFTPHPLSRLIHEAHFVFEWLQDSEKAWPRLEQRRLRIDHTKRRRYANVNHLRWLEERGNCNDLWSRAHLDEVRSDDELSIDDDPCEPWY